jgi:hypothetical protein
MIKGDWGQEEEEEEEEEEVIGSVMKLATEHGEQLPTRRTKGLPGDKKRAI